MKIAVVRKLVQEKSHQELENAAKDFEDTLENTLQVEGDDDGEILSHLLVASHARRMMDEGASINEALRDYSQRVRKIIGKKH